MFIAKPLKSKQIVLQLYKQLFLFGK